MDNKKKELIAGIYNRGASGYADIGYFPVYGRRLVEIAEITPGANVLDVACGRGAVLFPAAERVGPSGRVTGIDISAGMVKETADEIIHRGMTNAAVMKMDAEALEFHDAYFDFVLCAFSLQFFTDAVKAVREFKRVLKPDGKLAVATWGPDDPKWDWWDELMVETGVSTPLRSRDVTTPSAVRELLIEGGFADVTSIVEESDHIYPTRRAWWNKSWSLSSRVTLERLDEEAMGKLRTAVEEKLDEMEEADGWHEWHEVVYSVAS